MEQFFEKFESVTEFIHTINTRKVRESFENSQSSQTKNYQFTGTEDYKEANDLFLYGDKNNANKLNEASRKTKAQGKGNETRNKLYNSPCGFMPIVPKVLAGDPQNMLSIRKEKYSNTKVLNIVYNVTIDWSIKADEIVETAAKVANVIATLEKNGYRVNLYVYDCGKGLRDTISTILVKIKDSGEYLDTLRIAYPLVNPSFVRRHMRAYLERLEGYGLFCNYSQVLSDNQAEKYLPIKNASYLSFYNCEDKTEDGIIKMIETAK